MARWPGTEVGEGIAHRGEAHAQTWAMGEGGSSGRGFAWLGDSGVEADSLPHVSSGEGVLFSGHVVQGRGHEG